MSGQELEELYRPSSTLIIVAKSSCKEQGCNYRILLSKRSESIAFAPDHYVFPGGVLDPKADENIGWLVYFQDFGISKEDLDQLSLHHLTNRPKPLMTNGSNFTRDISLRITAIRETFEEVGVLLCIERNGFKINNGRGTFKYNFDKFSWQPKVHNNAMEFLNLCKFLDVVPDLWSLHEWSIWRSPPTALKKYDTALYVVALKDQPELLLEPTEVEKELWSTPSSALTLYKNRHMWLAPMQFYEISRLCNFVDWRELKTFIKNRSSRGSTLIMLAYFKCTDYLVGLLPGDDYYPDCNSNHKETGQLPRTAEEFKDKTKNTHRITFYDMYSLEVTANTPIDGHLIPVMQTNNSKL